jgi:hypothetical protein
MSLHEIEREFLTSTDIPPGRLAELLILLSAKYAEASNQLEAILLSKPSIWNEMRKEYKSDKATDRAWEATEYGLGELKWEMQLKKIQKLMSASKTMIDVRTNEARNMF